VTLDAAPVAAFVFKASPIDEAELCWSYEPRRLMSEPLPVLRCESRRPPAFERGFLLWSLALVLLGAAALDAFWATPRRQRVRVIAPIVKCHDTPAEKKVEDIKLLTPTQAAR